MLETSLGVQWLRFHVSTSEGMGSVHGWGTKILHAMQQAKKKRIKKENSVKFKPPELQTVTIFGVRAFTEEIKVK